MRILYDVVPMHHHYHPQLLHSGGICTSSPKIQTWHNIIWCHLSPTRYHLGQLPNILPSSLVCQV